MSKKVGTILLKVFAFVALMWALRVFLRQYLIDGTISRLVEGIGIWAPMTFVIVCALGVIILLPPRLFIGLAAIAFGKTTGAFYSLLSLTLGACAAFLSGRYLVTDLAHKLKKGKLKKVDEWAESHGVGLVLYLRLIFFGAPMLNYVVSSTSIRFRDYFWGSLIGLIPFVILFSYAVNILVTADSFKDVFSHPILLALPGLRLAGAVLLMLLVRHRGGEETI